MNKEYRNGPIGALMDEYKRASDELKALVRSIPQENFVAIADPDTEDADCRSVQKVMNHVVKAGYGYSNYIRKQFGDPWDERKENYELSDPETACIELDKMLEYTVVCLNDKWEISFEDIKANSMMTNWGQEYDFEQLLEHAVVHILRHRRQIERFIIKMGA